MLDPLLLDLPTFVRTERLLLRPPQTDEGPLLLDAATESLPELRPFLGNLCKTSPLA